MFGGILQDEYTYRVRNLGFAPMKDIPNQVHRSFNLDLQPMHERKLLQEANASEYGLKPIDVAKTFVDAIQLPKHADYQIGIPGGWACKRYGFTLIVDTYDNETNNITETTYISGWTSHADTTHNGAMGDDVIMFVNSIRSVNYYIDEATKTIVPTRAEAYNLVYNPTSGVSALINDQGQRIVRPRELIRAVTKSSTSGMDSYTDNLTQVVTEYDSPEGILATLANSIVSGARHTHTGEISEIVANATGSATPPSIVSNRFFSALVGITSDIDPKKFSFRQLKSIDESLNDPNRYQIATESPVIIDTDENGNPVPEAIIAYRVNNLISGLFQEKFMSTISFTATNRVMSDSPIPVVVTPGKNKSIVAGDIQSELRELEGVMKYIAENIFPIISRNNTIPLSITYSGEWMGIATIEVSINGGILTPYIYPTVASALFTPTVTTIENRESLVASTFNLVNTAKTVI